MSSDEPEMQHRPMGREAYVGNVRLFLQAGGWVLTEQPEAHGSERWRAFHLDSGAVLTSGDLEYLVDRAMRTLREKYLEARRAASAMAS